MIEHGTESRYTYHACRCEECREAHRIDQRRKIEARYALRVLIDGRLVAPGPNVRHGQYTTYNAHGCRCTPCTAANTAQRRQQQRPR